MGGVFATHQVAVQSTFIFLLLALSIQFPLRMGVFSFAGAGCFALGAYTTGIVVIHLHVTTALALLSGVLVSGLVGVLLALALRRLTGLYLGMATVAFDLIISTIAVNGGSLTGGPTGLYGVLAKPPLHVPHLVVLTVVSIVLLAMTERGSLGRRIENVREDPELATALGIRVGRYRMAAFVVGGCLGGLAGAVNILIRTTVSPETVGFSLVTLALTMIIVGGTSSWAGALIGAVVFTWLPEVLVGTAEWRPIVYGAIVALAAVWTPGGVVGAVRTARRRRQQRTERDRLRAGTPTGEAAATDGDGLAAAARGQRR